MMEMSQYEILKILEKEKKPMTSKEIASKLGVMRGNICVSLKMLRKYKEVEWVEKRGRDGKKIYYSSKKKEKKNE